MQQWYKQNKVPQVYTRKSGLQKLTAKAAEMKYFGALVFGYGKICAIAIWKFTGKSWQCQGQFESGAAIAGCKDLDVFRPDQHLRLAARCVICSTM